VSLFGLWEGKEALFNPFRVVVFRGKVFSIEIQPLQGYGFRIRFLDWVCREIFSREGV
jgi:hypothetical protein